MKWARRFFRVFVVLAVLSFGMTLYYRSTQGGRATAVLVEGNRLLLEGDIDNAEAHFSEAISLVDSLSEEDQQLGLLSAQLGLANVHLAREQYQAARSLLQDNISTYESVLIPRDVQACVAGAMSHSNLAVVNIYLGNYQLAETQLELAEIETEAISNEEFCKNRLLQSISGFQVQLWYIVNMNWALLWRNSGRFDLALEHYQRALELDVNVPQTKAQLGLTYLETGDFEKADSLISESEDPLALGILALTKKEHSLAVTHFVTGLESAQTSDKTSEQFVCHTGLGHAYEALGEVELAEEHFARAKAHTESLASALPEKDKASFLQARVYGFSRSDPANNLDRLLSSNP